MPRIPVKLLSEWDVSHGTSLLISGSPWEDGEPFSARDIVSLTGLSNMLLVDSQKCMKDCVVAFIIHLSVLRRLDLSQRSCKETTLSELQQASFEDFFSSFSNICITIVEKMSFKELWDVFDLVDGRILRQIFGRLQTLALPLCIREEVRRFANIILQLTDVDLSESIPQCQLARNIPIDTLSLSANASESVPPSVLGFSHPALDDYLDPVKISTRVSADPQPAPNMKVFEEISHWHNARVPIDSSHKIQRKGYFANWRTQKLMASTIAYSASLTNSAGKDIHPEIIVSTSVTDHSSNEGKGTGKECEGVRGTSHRALHQHHNKKIGQRTGRQNALEEAQKIQAEKNKSKAMATWMAWNQRVQEFEAEMNLDSRCLRVIQYVNGLSTQHMAIVGGEVILYLCNCLAYMLLEAKKKRKRVPGMLESNETINTRL